ncbi:MAG: NTPase [Candidatus Aminicenantes bacterium]|nr:NTPase [Candidatus Aminicenantes bacterium]
MNLARPHLLITGRPRTGKTTLIAELIKHWPDKCGGFITEEIRERGDRLGFRLRTLEGRVAILASVNLSSPYRVSRYGVDIESLERIGVEAILKAINSKEIIVIDEIGKMELYSEKFKQAVLRALDSTKRVLGVIHLAKLPFLERIRSRPDVMIFEVNGENNEEIKNKLISIIETGAG